MFVGLSVLRLNVSGDCPALRQAQGPHISIDRSRDALQCVSCGHISYPVNLCNPVNRVPTIALPR